MRNPKNSTLGMTLVEVLIALVFIFFGLASLISLHMQLTRRAARTQHKAQAACLAQSHLASLQLAGYAALEERIATLAESPEAQEASYAESRSSDLDSDYRWSAHLRKEEVDGVRRIAIQVEVDWSAPLARKGSGAKTAEKSIVHGNKKEVVGYVVAP